MFQSKNLTLAMLLLASLALPAAEPPPFRFDAPPFSNIVMTGNTFIRPGSAAIRLDSFHGGVIAGNGFEQTARPPIELKRCSGIREENNLITSDPPVKQAQ